MFFENYKIWKKYGINEIKVFFSVLVRKGKQNVRNEGMKVIGIERIQAIEPAGPVPFQSSVILTIQELMIRNFR